MTELKIDDGHVVEFHYTLTDASGNILDSSKDQDPMPYLHGKQNIVSGLEKKMTGKMVGDKFQVTVLPEDGYGKREDSKVLSVPKEEFENPQEIQVGEQFQIQDPGGNVLLVQVSNIEDQHIILDGNHPLAGVTLNFDIEIKSIRSATDEELAHGHLHSHGSCC